MSSSSAEESVFVSLTGQLILFRIISAACFTVLYYDYTLTFSTEVNVFWRRKGLISYGSILFFVTRYLAVLGYIPIIVMVFVGPPLSDHICTGLQIYLEYVFASVQTAVALACHLRVSALYNGRRSRIVNYGLFAFALLIPVTWTYNVLSQNTSAVVTAEASAADDIDLSFMGCVTDMPEEASKSISQIWAVVFAFDTTVFGLTLYKALEIGWSNSRTLWNVILRDGTSYWSILFTSNLVNIIVLLHAPNALHPVATSLTSILSATLISRLMMNLRIQNQMLEAERAQAIELDCRVSQAPIEFASELEPAAAATQASGTQTNRLLSPSSPPPTGECRRSLMLRDKEEGSGEEDEEEGPSKRGSRSISGPKSPLRGQSRVGKNRSLSEVGGGLARKKSPFSVNPDEDL